MNRYKRLNRGASLTGCEFDRGMIFLPRDVFRWNTKLYVRNETFGRKY
jgi:hypothetical protein